MGEGPARRAIERVVYDAYDIRTWYASPYPVDDEFASSTLYVCAGCFKYLPTAPALHAHRRACVFRHPPGKKVYQRGAHIIWEVDGAQEKLYVQNLCLFGKFFIDHKTVYFDVEPFVCYVLTDATSQFDHVLGFFSKEKVSYDDYNLACIVVFPPFQRKGYGTLLMEYSYYLSRAADVAGTPERPLSALGLRGYVAYWTSAVLRTLQHAYTSDTAHARRIRAALAGADVSLWPQQPKRRKTVRGWAGEVVKDHDTDADVLDTPLATQTTIARVAYAAGLRVDDTTLALAHAGLLAAPVDEAFALSAAAVDAAAQRLRIKPAILDEAYVL